MTVNTSSALKVLSHFTQSFDLAMQLLYRWAGGSLHKRARQRGKRCLNSNLCFARQAMYLAWGCFHPEKEHVILI